MSRRAVLPALASVVALASAGCGLLTAPHTIAPRYFVLNAVAPATGVKTDLGIGLGPVVFPTYLDRPEMARRIDANQIGYASNARWAEPLKSNFERALAANLVQLMGPQRLVSFPWYRTAQLDFTVTIAIARFEQQPDDTLMLAVRWVLRDRHDTPLAVETPIYTRPGGTPEENATRMSALVADLAEAIASRIQAVPPPDRTD